MGVHYVDALSHCVDANLSTCLLDWSCFGGLRSMCMSSCARVPQHASGPLCREHERTMCLTVSGPFSGSSKAVRQAHQLHPYVMCAVLQGLARGSGDEWRLVRLVGGSSDLLHSSQDCKAGACTGL